LQPTFLDFTGYSQTKKANYHVKLEFFGEIDPSASQINHSARDIEMVLRKKEMKEEYWPRLLKEKVKYHFLKTNFDKVRRFDTRRWSFTTDIYSGLTKMSKKRP